MGIGCAFPTRFEYLQKYFIITFILSAGIGVWGPVLFPGAVSLSHYVTACAVLLGIFTILAFYFYLLGQQLGRLFSQGKYALIGYTVNIAGNLAGIIAFNILSMATRSATLLFAAGIIALLYFYHKRHQVLAFSAFMILITLGETAQGPPDLAGDFAALYGVDVSVDVLDPHMEGFFIFIPFLLFLFLSWVIARILFWNLGKNRVNPGLDWHLFFMGAAFMVVETAGISHLSACSGSCLVGNSLVISFIFVFMFAANFYVLRSHKDGFLIPYLGLALCLLIAFLTNTNVSNWRLMESILATGAIVSAPVFFSSIIFARAIKNTIQPEIALASNLLGCVLGAGIEPVSMFGGNAALPMIALGLYSISYIFLRRKEVLSATADPPAAEALSAER